MKLGRILGMALVALTLAGGSAARAEEKPLSRIAFGSCNHQGKPQPVWEPIVEMKPQLFLFIGDNIYGDVGGKDVNPKSPEYVAEIHARYAKLGSNPGYRKLTKTCPILATWDDHDFGLNNSGSDYPLKKETQREFLDFFGVPKDSPRRQQEGVYSAQVFGPEGKRVQVILLDTRYHRSRLATKPGEGKNKKRVYVPTTDPKATMLGDVQWRWLGEQLRQPAELRLLVSSIQVISEDHGGEKWMNIPAEREKLFGLIKETQATGVVILSGDRHFADLSVMDAGVGYPMYDLTSSGMTQGAPHFRYPSRNPHRAAGMAWGLNWGAVEVDWKKPDPVVSLEVRDEDGDVRVREDFPLSLLRPKGKAAAQTPEPAKKGT